MAYRDIPIQKKVTRVILFISAVVLLVTCMAFLAYEYHAFRQNSMQKLSTLGKVIAANSTAALAFDDKQDATEILTALKAESHIVSAGLYDKKGKLFAIYPDSTVLNTFPVTPGKEGYLFSSSYIDGFEPVIQNDHQLGMLYLKSDLEDMYARLKLFGVTALIVVCIVSTLAYVLSKILQRNISSPILEMAESARAISERRDYSVRFKQEGKDELGMLSDAFNQLLGQIHDQNTKLSEFNQTLEQRIADRTIELQTVNKELESFTYSLSSTVGSEAWNSRDLKSRPH